MVYCISISEEMSSFLNLLIVHQCHDTARILHSSSHSFSHILNKPAISVFKHLRNHLLEFSMSRSDRTKSTGLLVNTVKYPFIINYNIIQCKLQLKYIERVALISGLYYDLACDLAVY